MIQSRPSISSVAGAIAIVAVVAVSAALWLNSSSDSRDRVQTVQAAPNQEPSGATPSDTAIAKFQSSVAGLPVFAQGIPVYDNIDALRGKSAYLFVGQLESVTNGEDVPIGPPITVDCSKRDGALTGEMCAIESRVTTSVFRVKPEKMLRLADGEDVASSSPLIQIQMPIGDVGTDRTVEAQRGLSAAAPLGARMYGFLRVTPGGDLVLAGTSGWAIEDQSGVLRGVADLVWHGSSEQKGLGGATSPSELNI